MGARRALFNALCLGVFLLSALWTLGASRQRSGYYSALAATATSSLRPSVGNSRGQNFCRHMALLASADSSASAALAAAGATEADCVPPPPV